MYLIGGQLSERTSEKVKVDGSVEEGFVLKYDTRYNSAFEILGIHPALFFDSFACSISDPDKEEVIITGNNWQTGNKVSVYGEDGWRRDLAPLNQGRFYHTCGSYINGGEKVNIIQHSLCLKVPLNYQFLMVTGGYTNTAPAGISDRAEIFSDNVWKIVAGKLPIAARDLTGVTVDNRVLIFGNKSFLF